MTIIETMLEKTKARVPAGSTVPHGVHTHPRRSDMTAPHSSIEARRLAIDPVAARENRLLLGMEQKDRGAMAAYGMLRTRLLHRARAKGWTTIAVTSAAPQDGKSLTALNLSLSLARERNSSIVLLDCDFCNPSICHLLGIAPPIELREFFQQKSRAPNELFVSIGIDNLLIAGNTAPAEQSAELLGSSRLEELFEFVKRSAVNPLVLIDLPPIVSPDDALVVAPRVDALLMVVSQEVTPRAELQKALDLASHFPLAGLVMNRSTDVRGKYAYGYGYGVSPRPPRG